jgi:hypothetical protein
MPVPEFKRRLREQTPQKKIEQVRNQLEKYFQSEKHHKQDHQMNQELKSQICKTEHSNQHQQAER